MLSPQPGPVLRHEHVSEAPGAATRVRLRLSRVLTGDVDQS